MESELQKKQLLLAADEMPLLRECAFFKSEDGFVFKKQMKLSPMSYRKKCVRI